MPGLSSAVALGGCSATEPVGLAHETDGLQSKAQMKKPTTDSAEYSSLTLEQNGLAVLLCSDARAEKAAAAMNVRRIHALPSCPCEQLFQPVWALSPLRRLILGHQWPHKVP